MDLLILIIYKILQYYYYILVASVLLSWIPDLKRSSVGRIIDKLADPYMRIFRGWIVIGVMDFTPILGFMFYYFGLNAVGQMLSGI